MNLRGLRPAVLLDRSHEGQPSTIGRPPRARVANAAGDRARWLAAVRPGEPDRGVIGILLFIDAHAHERDLRSVWRDLRIGHPHEREDVLLGDIAAAVRARAGPRAGRTQLPGRSWGRRGASLCGFPELGLTHYTREAAARRAVHGRIPLAFPGHLSAKDGHRDARQASTPGRKPGVAVHAPSRCADPHERSARRRCTCSRSSPVPRARRPTGRLC